MVDYRASQQRGASVHPRRHGVRIKSSGKQPHEDLAKLVKFWERNVCIQQHAAYRQDNFQRLAIRSLGSKLQRHDPLRVEVQVRRAVVTAKTSQETVGLSPGRPLVAHLNGEKSVLQQCLEFLFEGQRAGSTCTRNLTPRVMVRGARSTRWSFYSGICISVGAGRQIHKKNDAQQGLHKVCQQATSTDAAVSAHAAAVCGGSHFKQKAQSKHYTMLCLLLKTVISTKCAENDRENAQIAVINSCCIFRYSQWTRGDTRFVVSVVIVVVSCAADVVQKVGNQLGSRQNHCGRWHCGRRVVVVTFFCCRCRCPADYRNNERASTKHTPASLLLQSTSPSSRRRHLLLLSLS